MSVVPYVAGASMPYVAAGGRYVVREGFAGAVEGAAANVRKRVRDALSGHHNGSSNGGHSVSTATKVPRSVPRMRRYQRAMIQDCCESLFETKILNSTYTDIRPSALSTFSLLNGLGQSTGGDGRIANRVSNRFLKLNYNLQIAPNNKADVIRTLVVIDRQPNNAAATHSDLFDSNTSIGNLNREKVGRGRRFHILKDMRVAITPTNSMATFSLNIPLKFRTTYSIPDSTISGIASYALYIVTVGGQSLDDRVYVSYSYELFYKDA